MDTFARFAEVDAAFDVALTLAPDDRAQYLCALSQTDTWLADRVEKLLEATAHSDSFMSPGGAIAGPFATALSSALGADERTAVPSVGRYSIVREIGRGGMSVVYLAHRATDDFEHDVAIKVLKRGVDTDDVIRRFEQERRILASLDHPGVARLFDGGTTDDGRPYIVMEHVHGTAIDWYCEEHRLTVRARLRLFLDVARAVQYAHRNLIVHRDLKPGNVLVTADGRIKLLDFGIAKLLDDRDASSAPSTRPALLIMTPDYASPEQRRGEPVTTASDVYQLGLILYKLLAGRRAFETRDRTGLVEPPTPSAVARERNRPAIDRELDSIVLMALRGEPDRRYASVEQFAEDIERFLESMPVLARPATLQYRMRKFARRHQMGVGVAAAFLVATLGYAWLITFQARELAAQRDRARVSAATAERVARFMVDVFTLASPTEGEGTSVSARELLDQGARRLETELGDQPEVLAEMLRAAGNSYFGLGLNAQAEPLLRRSVDLLRPLGGSSPELAASLNDLGRLLHEQGKGDEAQQLLTEALNVRQQVHGPEHANVATTLHNLGRVRREAGDYAEAERLFRASLDIRERSLGHDDPAVAQGLHNLGLTKRAAGDLANAEPLLRQALDIRRRRLGDDHPDTTDSKNALGLLLRDRGNAAAAEPLLRQALDSNRRRLGPQHPYVATTINNLALILRDQGKQEVAEPLYREALDLLRAAYGPRHPRVAIALFNLGAVLQDVGKYVQAEPLYREALEIDREARGNDHFEVAVTQMQLGALLHAAGKTAEAEPLLRDSLARLRETVGSGHLRFADAEFNLARLLIDTGRAAEAEPLVSDTISIRREKYGAADPRTLLARLLLSRAQAMQRQPPDMEAIVFARCRSISGRYRQEVTRSLDRLLTVLDRENQAIARDIRSGTICEQTGASPPGKADGKR